MAISKLIAGSLKDDAITSAKITDGAITNNKISASAGISLSKTLIAGTQPTISSLSISQKDPDVSSNVTITGTNFESIPIVQFVNTTTGARITSATVTYTSSTTIIAVFPASQTIGIYKVTVENPTGLSVISSTTIINSAAPNWVTSASLGSVEEGDTVNIQLLAYDDDSTAVSSYSLQSGSLPSGVTLSGDSTVGALTGTAPTVSADTAYNFTIRATDNESQTTDKAFSLTVADYNIGNSVMFNDNDSPYMVWTPSGSGDSTYTWTLSTWVKRCTNASTASGYDSILSCYDGSNYSINIAFGNGAFSATGDYFEITYANSSYAVQWGVRTNAVLRDPSAWYHLLVKFDTTQATANDRITLYVNGEEASVTRTNSPSQNTAYLFNTATAHNFGRYAKDSNSWFDGYIAETHFIDGSALTPSSFGETNSNGVWVPKKYSGSYGTNGFVLEFDSSGSLGADTSGNGNNFTANNLAATDQMQDTPHLNYATLNSLATFTSGVLSSGNLIHTGTAGTISKGFSTQAVSSGKWYAEVKNPNGTQKWRAGVRRADYMYFNDNEGIVLDYNYIYQQGTEGGTFEAVSWSGNNHIIGVALNKDDNQVTFYVDGTQIGSVQSLANTSEAYCFFSDDYSSSTPDAGIFQWNFGNPSFSIASGNSDANGYGNFEYEVPTGYYALNSKNLATYG